MRVKTTVTRVFFVALGGMFLGCAGSRDRTMISAADVIPTEIMTLPVKENPASCFPQTLVPTFAVFNRVNMSELANVPGRMAWIEEGMVIVVIRDKYGFCDSEGHIVISPRFDHAENFVAGRAKVEVGKKCGYIDRAGALVIEPKFDSAYSFRNGLGCVKVGEKWGIVDTDGGWIKEPVYQRLDPLVGGIQATTFDGRQAWVDQRGEMKPAAATK